MYIIELTYKKPLEEVDELLEDHILFLDRYYKAGIIIASGPQTPRNGGIILAQKFKEIGDEIIDINDIIKQDPFYIYGIADYRIVKFTPKQYDKAFEVFCQNEQRRNS